MKTYKSPRIKLAYKFIFLLSIIIILYSCEDFLEPETPLNQIEKEKVFENESTATAAVTSLYGKLRDQGFLNGGLSGNGYIFGLYADELDYHSYPGMAAESFYHHRVIPTNTLLPSIWNSSWSIIYGANSVIEGIEKSILLPEETKNQLKGEALFIRAFCHFHLATCFGDIPYIKTTDFTVNSNVSRMPIADVYDSILQDLIESQNLIASEYKDFNRVRPNKYVISALLARVYLYQNDYSKAELESTKVISNTSLYHLDADLDNVFLKDSPETIWQLKPQKEGYNTIEGDLYIITSTPPFNVALNENIVDAMEEDDLRKLHWIGEISDGDETWFYPYKYKERTNSGTGTEYSKVFRIAEQYLIRAEARLKLGNTTGAKSDLNKVRERAGLEETDANTLDELTNAILKERRTELFSEFGHRWFDLKRSGKASEYLSPIKSGWRITDLLLPIPESELLANPKLNPQNPGY